MSELEKLKYDLDLEVNRISKEIDKSISTIKSEINSLSDRLDEVKKLQGLIKEKELIQTPF